MCEFLICNSLIKEETSGCLFPKHYYSPFLKLLSRHPQLEKTIDFLIYKMDCYHLRIVFPGLSHFLSDLAIFSDYFYKSKKIKKKTIRFFATNNIFYKLDRIPIGLSILFYYFIYKNFYGFTSSTQAGYSFLGKPDTFLYFLGKKFIDRYRNKNLYNIIDSNQCYNLIDFYFLKGNLPVYELLYPDTKSLFSIYGSYENIGFSLLLLVSFFYGQENIGQLELSQKLCLSVLHAKRFCKTVDKYFLFGVILKNILDKKMLPIEYCCSQNNFMEVSDESCFLGRSKEARYRSN